MAQQTAERRIKHQSFRGGHPTRTTHGPFSRHQRELVEQQCGVRAEVDGRGPTDAPARSHKHDEEKLGADFHGLLCVRVPASFWI